MAVTKKKTEVKNTLHISTGRRKTSVARVRIAQNGTGKIVINGKDIEEYFGSSVSKQIVRQPLVLTNTEGKLDVFVNVQGGGTTGQAGAIRHGIARELVNMDEAYKASLKSVGFLTRDARKKERKKYGLKKARKSPQYSKR